MNEWRKRFIHQGWNQLALPTSPFRTSEIFQQVRVGKFYLFPGIYTETRMICNKMKETLANLILNQIVKTVLWTRIQFCTHIEFIHLLVPNLIASSVITTSNLLSLRPLLTYLACYLSKTKPARLTVVDGVWADSRWWGTTAWNGMVIVLARQRFAGWRICYGSCNVRKTSGQRRASGWFNTGDRVMGSTMPVLRRWCPQSRRSNNGSNDVGTWTMAAIRHWCSLVFYFCQFWG